MKIALIVVAIFAVLTVIYFVTSYTIRKKHYQTINELMQKKNELVDKPVSEDLHKGNELKLTGQTEKEFKKWKGKWEQIEQFSFPQIENYLFDAKQFVDQLKLKDAERAEKQARQKIQETNENLKETQKALKEIVGSEEKNRTASAKLKENYKGIRKKMLTQSFSFGPAIEPLERKLTSLESEFAAFDEASSQGDHMGAKEIVKEIRKKTEDMEETVAAVPQLLKELTEEQPQQLKEIKSGYRELKERHYQFQDDNIMEEINRADEERQHIIHNVGKLELEEANDRLPELEKQIDHLYEIMEIELAAHDYVKENYKLIAEYIEYLTGQNDKLILEIDRVSQSYQLNHKELEQAQSLKEKLEHIEKDFVFYDDLIQNDEAIYSEVETAFKKDASKLAEIEKKQLSITNNLKELRKDELEIKNRIDDYELDVRAIKRYVEKQHLPGLPSDYLDLFFSTSDRIEYLSSEIGRFKIDIDEIKEIAQMCEEDIELLTDKTDTMVDSALLAEYMVQYANRYRQTNPQIASSIQKGMDAFYKEYHYQEALEIISTALEEVEPGAFKKVEASYYEDKAVQ